MIDRVDMDRFDERPDLPASDPDVRRDAENDLELDRRQHPDLLAPAAYLPRTTN